METYVVHTIVFVGWKFLQKNHLLNRLFQLPAVQVPFTISPLLPTPVLKC